MNKTGIICIAAALLLGGQAMAQNTINAVSYAIPQTVLRVRATIERTTVYPGPLAKYAASYLETAVPLDVQVSERLISVKVVPYTEACQTKRNMVFLSSDTLPFPLTATEQGLVSGVLQNKAGSSNWQQNKEVDNTAKERIQYACSVYGVSDKPDYITIEHVMEKLSDLREKRYKIMIGDTDANYSGDALRAIIDEFNRQEELIMSLFLGYSTRQTFTKCMDIVPEEGRAEQKFKILQLEDGNTLQMSISTEDVISPAEISKPTKSKEPQQYIVTMVPAPCSVQISTTDQGTLYNTRCYIYQLGAPASIPVFNK